MQRQKPQAHREREQGGNDKTGSIAAGGAQDRRKNQGTDRASRGRENLRSTDGGAGSARTETVSATERVTTWSPSADLIVTWSSSDSETLPSRPGLRPASLR